MIFDTFVSEITAFGCSYSHCFHTVRNRRWSKVWSDLKSHITIPISHEPQTRPRWLFYYCHHTIKLRIIQVPFLLKICITVIKDKRFAKTGFTIEVIVVNITFREMLSQKIFDLKILQVFIETLLIFRRN